MPAHVTTARIAAAAVGTGAKNKKENAASSPITGRPNISIVLVGCRCSSPGLSVRVAIIAIRRSGMTVTAAT
jgi:hypothetical protein